MSVVIDLKPLPCKLDEIIKPWGRCVALGIRDGERWFQFIDKHNVVSLIPGPCVRAHKEANK